MLGVYPHTGEASRYKSSPNGFISIDRFCSATCRREHHLKLLSSKLSFSLFMHNNLTDSSCSRCTELHLLHCGLLFLYFPLCFVCFLSTLLAGFIFLIRSKLSIYISIALYTLLSHCCHLLEYSLLLAV